MTSPTVKTDSRLFVQQSFRKRNQVMFNNSLLSDVKFLVLNTLCEEECPKRVSIPAHKYVLAISSPVFFAMFYGELAETRDTIELPDCDSEGFLELLRYMYCDEAKVTGKNVMQVLYLAKKFLIPSLVKICIQFLELHVNIDNVLDIVSTAAMYQEETLLQRCWNLIDEETDKIMKLNSFTLIGKNFLSSLLARQTLECSELQLFEAVMRWASTQCKHAGLPDDGKTKRALLGEELVKMIRFPKMKEEEFAKFVLPADFLNNEEIVELSKRYNRPPLDGPGFGNCSPLRSNSKQILRCRRFFGSLFCWWSYNKETEDAIAFSVNSPISLCGVRLYSNGEKGAEYRVTIGLHHRKWNSVSYVFQSAVILHESSREFDVKFENSVIIAVEEEYVLSAAIEGPRSYYRGGGKSSVDCEGIAFRFLDTGSRTSVNKGQFSELLFKKC